MMGILDFSKIILTAYHKRHNGSMNQMKLQKLCYYSQAWFYTFYGKPIVDDIFLALEKGPVCETLIDKYTCNDSNEIIFDDNDYCSFDDETKKFVNAIIDLYGGFSGEVLSEITHSESPWIIARNNVLLGKRALVIDLESMRRCYAEHSLHSVFSKKLDKSFSYKKVVILKNSLILVNLMDEELKTTRELVHELSIQANSEEMYLHEKIYKGKMYEFFQNEYNIILITKQVKDYIMAQTKLIS